MTISFVSAGTQASGSGATITPGLPANIQSGDLLVALVINSSAGEHTVSANTYADWPINVSFFIDYANSALFFHWYDGSDPDRQFNSDVSGGAFVGGIAAFRGVNYSTTYSDFFRGGASHRSDGTDASIEFASLALTAGDMELLAAGAYDDNDVSDLANYSFAFGPGAGNSYKTTTGAPDAMVTLAYRLIAATTDYAPTLTQSASDPWYASHVALIPSTTVATTHPLLALGVGN